MKAITVTNFGGPEVLQVVDILKPTPGPEQLLVKVHATALNRADTLQRQGKYAPPPGESETLGLEIAGEIAAWGAGVSGFKKGQRVFGLVGGGGYAEYCLIDAAMAMLVPENWHYTQAAAVPEVFFTADETVFELGQLQRGESILVHAGASGVGSAAVQMAHYVGATVYFTAGTEEKINKVLALGATHGINRKTEDFAEEIARLTQGQGVDVIEDFVGADYFPRNIQSLKPSGRLICIALMRGSMAEIDLKQVIFKRLQIKGSIMRIRSLEDKRLITKRFQKRWLPVLAAGKISPVIDSIFSLEEAAKAHERMEANLNFGKMILTIQ